MAPYQDKDLRKDCQICAPFPTQAQETDILDDPILNPLFLEEQKTKTVL
jgi:hypothetical protein